MDTAANVSCIESVLAAIDFSSYPNYQKRKSYSFNLLPDVIGSIDIVNVKELSNVSSTMPVFDNKFEVLSESDVKQGRDCEQSYPLTQSQLRQLEAVKELFPNNESKV